MWACSQANQAQHPSWKFCSSLQLEKWQIKDLVQFALDSMIHLWYCDRQMKISSSWPSRCISCFYKTIIILDTVLTKLCSKILTISTSLRHCTDLAFTFESDAPSMRLEKSGAQMHVLPNKNLLVFINKVYCCIAVHWNNIKNSKRSVTA